MIITHSTDGSEITITSEYLESAAGKVIDSIVLKSRLNCSSSESSLDLSDYIPDIVNGELQVSSAIFYNNESSTSFCDGVYYFSLEVQYTISSIAYLAKESVCHFFDTVIACDLQDYFIKTNDTKPFYYHYALTQASNCDSCYCTTMCIFYTQLKNILHGYSNTTSADDCGCS